MSHSFQVTDDIYQTLVAIAAAHSQTPEDLFEAWVSEMATQSALDPAIASRNGYNIYDPADDPLAPFRGAFEAMVPDLVWRHDDYLGPAAAETHETR